MYTVSVSKILLVLYMGFALDCLCREFHIQDISTGYIYSSRFLTTYLGFLQYASTLEYNMQDGHEGQIIVK